MLMLGVMMYNNLIFIEIICLKMCKKLMYEFYVLKYNLFIGFVWFFYMFWIN